jgi:holo-[acyl-carrier protein] synthase
MIFGIGVDIVQIDRLKRMHDRFGDRVARRLLTSHEFDQFQQRRDSVRFLATRFAAKEAVSKAFGTGIARGIGFHSIEVRNDTKGKPHLKFYDAARDFVMQQQITNSLLTLSDEKSYAVAMVVLETG